MRNKSKGNFLVKIAAILFLFLGFSNFSYGQINVLNEKFNIAPQNCDVDHFYSCVNGWKVTHGGPYIFDNAAKLNADYYGACAPISEGIVTTNTDFCGFKRGRKYRINFRMKANSSNSGNPGAPNFTYYSVLAANNVPFRATPQVFGASQLPCNERVIPNLNQIDHQVIIGQNTQPVKGELSIDNQWKNFSIDFEPQKEFEHLWIYTIPAPGGMTDGYYSDYWLYIDEITIDVIGSECNNCALTDKYYQITTNLPNYTKVSNTIYAGRDVVPGSFAPKGDVAVLNGQNVVFQAAQNIQLKEGFSVEPGGNFEAKIAACNVNSGVSVSIQEMINNAEKCSTTLTAIPCSESESSCYTYQWSTGETSSSIVISDFAACYTVTVTESGTGKIGTATFCKDENYSFTGEFTFNPPSNLILKGCNVFKFDDNWKTTYAYKAYKYELNIYSQWGNLVKQIKSNEIGRPGFKHGDIWWDGYGVSDGTYYWALKLWNCTYPNGKQAANGWVDVMSGNCKVANNNGATQSSNGSTAARIQNSGNGLPLSQLSVYPNPVANGSFAFTCTLAEGTNTVRFFNSQGSLVKELSINSASIKGYEGNIEVGSLAAGIYHLSLENSNGRESTSVVIQK